MIVQEKKVQNKTKKKQKECKESNILGELDKLKEFDTRVAKGLVGVVGTLTGIVATGLSVEHMTYAEAKKKRQEEKEKEEDEEEGEEEEEEEDEED